MLLHDDDDAATTRSCKQLYLPAGAWPPFNSVGSASDIFKPLYAALLFTIMLQSYNQNVVCVRGQNRNVVLIGRIV